MNKTKVYTTIGASNHVPEPRQNEDYYATDPIAIEQLLEHENFRENIIEIAVGGGHLANRLLTKGYNVIGYDIIDRGFKNTIIQDFLQLQKIQKGWDIITNPPYVLAKEFVEHALDLVDDNIKIAMFLKLTFLESSKRLELLKSTHQKQFMYIVKELNVLKMGCLMIVNPVP